MVHFKAKEEVKQFNLIIFSGMLKDTHELNFTFLDVGGGDAIWTRFLGNDKNWHNILIDGGYAKTYRDGFGPLIRSITAKERVDLWVISHIDLDHIGAVLGFTEDKAIKDKPAAVAKFWFNHSPLLVAQGTGKLGVVQGVKVRTYLEQHGLLSKEGITTKLEPSDFWGLRIKVLSPSPEKARVADELWKEEEHRTKTGRRADQADHKQKFEDLANKDFSEDSNPWNGSSIALLLEFNGVRALLLADSHPSTVAESLCRLGFSAEKPLDATFVQLSHHGSKVNTSAELLRLINTDTYVVTGNGITNRHPDKETLVRVLSLEGRPQRTISFIFSSDSKELRGLFAVDGEVYSKYDFCCIFPEAGQLYQSLNYLPLNETNDE
ncbi:ComEC/Rec2 family competence protein [Chitinophaga sp. CF118]|uniref:ComEC/Rec2 family competence protein n=1 Tax=Chitinophaga sp. CF118 TaxID=1884367 RepID=UPI002100EE7B|nr:MBL fold metallo-hydrolase [Chitinophaga sp. CF118]